VLGVLDQERVLRWATEDAGWVKRRHHRPSDGREFHTVGVHHSEPPPSRHGPDGRQTERHDDGPGCVMPPSCPTGQRPEQAVLATVGAVQSVALRHPGSRRGTNIGRVVTQPRETGMAAAASIDAYLEACPDDARAALEHLRTMIKAAAPEATATNWRATASRRGRSSSARTSPFLLRSSRRSSRRGSPRTRPEGVGRSDSTVPRDCPAWSDAEPHRAAPRLLQDGCTGDGR
jgi:hypothetical protein